MGYNIDRQGNLTDLRGKTIGKVGQNNRVVDGWHDRGYIDQGGHYHNEYGRDQGRTDRDTGSLTGDAASAIGGVLFVGLFALFGWLMSKPWGRKLITVLGISVLVLILVSLAGNFVLSNVQNNARAKEEVWVLSNPDAVVSIRRIGPGNCFGNGCDQKTGMYSITNNLKTGSMQVFPLTPSSGFSEIIGAGQSVNLEASEANGYGENIPVCFYIAAFPGVDEKSLVVHDNQNPLCIN